MNESLRFYEALPQVLSGNESLDLQSINAWVRQATHGRLPQLLAQLPHEPRLVLLSAVHFQGMLLPPGIHPGSTRGSVWDLSLGSPVPMVHPGIHPSFQPLQSAQRPPWDPTRRVSWDLSSNLPRGSAQDLVQGLGRGHSCSSCPAGTLTPRNLEAPIPMTPPSPRVPCPHSPVADAVQGQADGAAALPAPRPPARARAHHDQQEVPRGLLHRLPPAGPGTHTPRHQSHGTSGWDVTPAVTRGSVPQVGRLDLSEGLSLVVLVPRGAPEALGAVERALDPPTFLALLQRAASTPTRATAIALPRMHLDLTMDVVSLVHDMGKASPITRPYNTREESPMSPAPHRPHVPSVPGGPNNPMPSASPTSLSVPHFLPLPPVSPRVPMSPCVPPVSPWWC